MRVVAAVGLGFCVLVTAFSALALLTMIGEWSKDFAGPILILSCLGVVLGILGVRWLSRFLNNERGNP